MIRTVDDFLRRRGRFALDAPSIDWRSISALILVCAPIYGFAMGMFGGSLEQGLYSALKLPLLIGGATALCLPSFYAINTVLGLREDFQLVFRAVLCAQAAVCVTLASLTPAILFAYASTADYATAVFSNGVLFAVATIAAQLVVRQEYAPLIRRDPRHRVARRVWVVLYVFVSIQLAWVLRPFIGDPNSLPQLFRREAWSNAYVVLAELLRRVFG